MICPICKGEMSLIDEVYTSYCIAIGEIDENIS